MFALYQMNATNYRRNQLCDTKWDVNDVPTINSREYNYRNFTWFDKIRLQE